MKDPATTPIHCSVCGTEMGKRPGVATVLGAVCTNVICQYQGEAPLQTQRDAFITYLADRGQAVSALAVKVGMSRQRVYQIIANEKMGI